MKRFLRMSFLYGKETSKNPLLPDLQFFKDVNKRHKIDKLLVDAELFRLAKQAGLTCLLTHNV